MHGPTDSVCEIRIPGRCELVYYHGGGHWRAIGVFSDKRVELLPECNVSHGEAAFVLRTLGFTDDIPERYVSAIDLQRQHDLLVTARAELVRAGVVEPARPAPEVPVEPVVAPVGWQPVLIEVVAYSEWWLALDGDAGSRVWLLAFRTREEGQFALSLTGIPCGEPSVAYQQLTREVKLEVRVRLTAALADKGFSSKEGPRCTVSAVAPG